MAPGARAQGGSSGEVRRGARADSSTRLVRIRRHVSKRVSANCHFWIGKLGIGVRRGLAGKNPGQRGSRLSDSAMWIVRLWVGWYGRLLAPSDSAGRQTAGIPADQILQRP